MPTSQNGFPASPDRNAIGVRTFRVPGAEHVLLPLRADVAPLLLEMARWWHITVEPLVVPGCWGYAYREIRGATQLSNHASGTAHDLNAPRHPLGAVGTVPAHLRAAISAKAKSLGLRWGGDYTGRKDEMHFEINVSRARALELVAQLQAPTQEEDMAGEFADKLLSEVAAITPVQIGRKIDATYILTDIYNLAQQGRDAARAMQPVLAQIAAAVAEGDLDPVVLGDRLEAASRQAASEGARRAVVETVLPEIQRIREALEADDASEAKAIVTELAERLRPAA